MIDYREHIVSDYRVMLGKPVIRGTRVTAELILKKLAEGMTIEELTQAYPHLQRNDVRAVLAYSAEVIGKEELLEA